MGNSKDSSRRAHTLGTRRAGRPRSSPCPEPRRGPGLALLRSNPRCLQCRHSVAAACSSRRACLRACSRSWVGARRTNRMIARGEREGEEVCLLFAPVCSIKHFGLISAICGAERKFESKRTLTRTISSAIDPQALSIVRGRLNVREEENVVYLDLLVFPTQAISFSLWGNLGQCVPCLREVRQGSWVGVG